MSERSELVAMLVHPRTEMVDPGDVSTWLVAGQPPSPEELALLRCLTVDVLIDVTTLLSVGIELIALEALI
ncbi:MAG: hypothetical protein QOI51_1173 [Nocardioidaceae bacterium]|jgi:hypothetical protein|nr:hypothetical protein [Nocardioidaceae bacterium]MDX6308984.1 hypothetical protein [Nocardioidaceae bacterium]